MMKKMKYDSMQHPTTIELSRGAAKHPISRDLQPVDLNFLVPSTYFSTPKDYN